MANHQFHIIREFGLPYAAPQRMLASTLRRLTQWPCMSDARTHRRVRRIRRHILFLFSHV